MIYDGTPASVTFAIFSPEMEAPTVIIGRNGGVKERKPFLQCIHPKVFVTQPKDYLGITAAQKRVMLKLAYIVLNKNPFCDIHFLGGSSPWGLMALKDRVEDYMPLKDLLQIPAYDIRKIIQRKRKRHPVIKEVSGRRC